MPIPASRAHLFWSQNIQKLDSVRDRPYIVHQTLAFGTLDDLAWLGSLYPVSAIRQTFVNAPIKIYSRAAYHFAKKLLSIADDEAPVERYDKTLLRDIG